MGKLGCEFNHGLLRIGIDLCCLIFVPNNIAARRAATLVEFVAPPRLRVVLGLALPAPHQLSSFGFTRFFYFTRLLYTGRKGLRPLPPYATVGEVGRAVPCPPFIGRERAPPLLTFNLDLDLINFLQFYNSTRLIHTRRARDCPPYLSVTIREIRCDNNHLRWSLRRMRPTRWRRRW